jgi:hypothetical protein
VVVLVREMYREVRGDNMEEEVAAGGAFLSLCAR